MNTPGEPGGKVEDTALTAHIVEVEIAWKMKHNGQFRQGPKFQQGFELFRCTRVNLGAKVSLLKAQARELEECIVTFDALFEKTQERNRSFGIS
jgi:hypothetical protein